MSYVYPQNDLEKPAQLMALLGSFWAGTYGGNHFVSQLASGRGLLEQAAERSLADAINSTSRFKVPIYKLDAWYQLVIRESAITNLAVPKYGESYVYGISDNYETIFYGEPVAHDVYSTALPATLAKLPLLVNRTDVPSITWFEGIDYVVADGYLQFGSNPFDNDEIPVRDVIENGVVTDREISLWGFRTSWDARHVWTHYGHILGVSLPSSERYRDLINSVWDAMVVGSSIDAVTDLLSAVSDSPTVLEDSETVLYVVEDAKHLLIITDAHAYLCGQNATAAVAVNAKVSKGEFLSNAVQLYSPGHDAKPEWLTAFALDESLTYKKYKGGLLFRDEETATEIDTSGPFTELRFAISGYEATVDEFWEDVHARGVEDGQTLAHLLDQRDEALQVGEPPAGALPDAINPLEFLLENVLRNNALVVLLQPHQFGTNRLPAWTINLIRRIISPHTAVLFLVRLEAEEEPWVFDEETLSGGVALTPLEESEDLFDYLGESELLPAGYVDEICS